MKQIDFHLDFISPYAYLAFAKLPEALAGIDCHVRYKPKRKRSIDTAIDAGGVGEVKARPIGDRVPNTRAEEPRSRRRFGPWGDC
jgi:2-hydroxychromene-2-carboxylate isomerase